MLTPDERMRIYEAMKAQSFRIVPADSSSSIFSPENHFVVLDKKNKVLYRGPAGDSLYTSFAYLLKEVK